MTARPLAAWVGLRSQLRSARWAPLGVLRLRVTLQMQLPDGAAARLDLVLREQSAGRDVFVPLGWTAVRGDLDLAVHLPRLIGRLQPGRWRLELRLTVSGVRLQEPAQRSPTTQLPRGSRLHRLRLLQPARAKLRADGRHVVLEVARVPAAELRQLAVR